MKPRPVAFHIITGLLLCGCEDPAYEPFEEVTEDLEHEEESADEDIGSVPIGADDLSSPPPPPTAYWAQTACSTAGGGTWGSILRLCVSINASQGTFTITKKDGTKFQSSGDFYLKRDNWSNGIVQGQYGFAGNEYSYYVQRFFQASEYASGSRYYYAYVTSDQGGYSWVGPVKINY